MTAVEYLIEQLQAPCRGIPSHIIEDAKQREKQQIIDAYEAGENNIDNDGCSISRNGAETYYNETFKKDL